VSVLLGADTRRVDAIADGLRGHSDDVQNLRSIAARAVAELRSSWAGGDFEGVAARWEQEAGPRLVDAASALSAMAGSLRAQAAEQRSTSSRGAGSMAAGSAGSSTTGAGTSTSTSTTGAGSAGTNVVGGVGVLGNGGPVATPAITRAATAIEELDPDDIVVSLRGLLAGDQDQIDTVKDHVKVNITAGETRADASLVSAEGGNDNAAYEVAAGRVEAGAGYSVDVDAHGDLVASAGGSAAAYLGYAAGKLQAGNDFARVGAQAKVLAGAEAGADASVSVGRGGVVGHLGAEAFAGAQAEVVVGGTVSGVSAAAGAEISYGIGAHANLDGDLSAAKVGLALDVGATIGIGTGVSFDVSINPQEVMDGVGHGMDELGDLLDW